MSGVTLHETEETQAVCWLQQLLGLQQPGSIHKALCPEGKVNNLFRGSPIPDTWARTKYLLGTLMITILVFSDAIFQFNVLILRTEMPVFL